MRQVVVPPFSPGLIQETDEDEIYQIERSRSGLDMRSSTMHLVMNSSWVILHDGFKIVEIRRKNQHSDEETEETFMEVGIL